MQGAVARGAEECTAYSRQANAKDAEEQALEAGVGRVTLGFEDGVGIELLVVLELRFEMLCNVRGDDGGEFGGVVVTAKYGCEYSLERIRFAEEVGDEGRRVRMECGEEELLEVLDAVARRPGGQGASDVELRKTVPECTAGGLRV